MLHDLVIVGAGPVGAVTALGLADSELSVVTLDARAEGKIGRSDRSLALSHGSRLILERLGIWGEVAAVPDAVTPIRAIDVSQRGGFGHVRLESEEQGVPALGYVVSYRALQGALDAALAGAGRRRDPAPHRTNGGFRRDRGWARRRLHRIHEPSRRGGGRRRQTRAGARA